MGGTRCRVQSAVAAVCAIAALLAVAASASARTDENDKQVTIVARVCPSYESIRGNRARNNIMESLKDLGPDTNYAAGEPLTAAKEAAPPQDQCQPITGWRFTLGTGYQSRAVTGPWGSLSKVTNPFSTDIVTKDSTPLLNDQGQQVGTDTIAGAVTITLTKKQLELAGTPSSLWIQGGTPTDPVLNTPYPGQYGFGALRCAIDNLNGDNVEWIAYPTWTKHVFCYAYYVQPPPTSGTIVVRKEVDAPSNQPKESFRFTGNISFNVDQSFTLAAKPGAPAQAVFYRAGGATWDFTEAVPGGWQLTAIDCVSQSGRSTSTTNLATGRTDVALADGDKVTCTYKDRLVPPVAGLLLRKISNGGTGAFDFSVKPPGGGAQTATASTSTPGVATDATPSFDALTPGDYDVTEKLPDSDRGKWALTGITCNDADRGTDNPLTVTLAAGTGTVCTYVNAFTPKGTIRLRKVTTGGTATAGFVVNSVGTTPPRRYEQTATTTAENSPALAAGDDTSDLPLGAYEISETGPASGATGAWRVNGVSCNGVAVPAAQGTIDVVLTEAHPDVDCTYYDQLEKPVVLPETVTGGSAQSTTPRADLVLRKHPERRVVTLGQIVRYFVTVTNRGPATARSITLVEQVGDRKALLAATPKRYRCSTHRRLPGCLIGTLRAGQTARLTVYVRSRFTGRRPNRAVVNTSTAETSRRNNVARSATFVRPRPHFTG